MSEEPADTAEQRRVARRRIVEALRRLHRRDPLRADQRVDAVLREVRTRGDRRPPTHRGAAAIVDDERWLRGVIDELVADRAVLREGHRIRLPEHRPALAPQLDARVEELLAGLRAAGASPPRADALAARLGIPAALLAELRAAGTLVAVAPGIDYPRDVYEQLAATVDRLAARRELGTAALRDELRTARRFAEALIAYRRAEWRRTGRSPGRPRSD